MVYGPPEDGPKTTLFGADQALVRVLLNVASSPDPSLVFYAECMTGQFPMR